MRNFADRTAFLFIAGAIFMSVNPGKLAIISFVIGCLFVLLAERLS